MAPLDPRAQEVLDYWFGSPSQDPTYFEEKNAFWFNGGEAVDDEIRRRFGALVEDAVAGRLPAWSSSPRGGIALIILLDQFSLNLYREKPGSYQQSVLAIPIAEQMIERGDEQALSFAERVFLYLPFEHGESLTTQETSIRHYERLLSEVPFELKETMEFYLEFARRHERVVRRFGRFPDRNEVFGRENTPEEERFLASDEAPF